MSDSLIPQEWKYHTVLELGDGHRDTVQTGPFGAQLHAEDYVEEGIPLILIKNIKESGLDETDIPKITIEDAERLSRYRVRQGDIVFSRVGRVGSCFLAEKEQNGWVISGQTLRMRVNQKKIYPRFLNYALMTEKVKKEIIGESVGTTRTSINTQILENLEVLVPPLPEQQKIASILTSVDEVIEKTQSQINKLQDLKKGTMNELLTRGIGHTEFVDSPVGKIPKGWDVVNLSDVTKNYDSKRVPVKSSERQNIQGIYRYYGASGVIDYVDNYLFDGTYILLGEDGENVVSRNLPLAFIVTGKFWVNNHAHIFQPKEGVDIGFLCEYLESLDYTNIASGSAQPKITKSSLEKIKVKLPSHEEQQKIASILSSIDQTIEQKQRQLEQTKSLKKSLMQDLLTGKKRVTI